MLATGVIGPSTSSWASPVCLVKKKDGTFRFCIDYRRINAVSKKDAYPIPDIQDALDNLRGSQYFATIDLLSGYWQLGMTDCTKERSAFCTRRGLFHFARMLFGLSGAPGSFCRLMSIVLRDLLWGKDTTYRFQRRYDSVAAKLVNGPWCKKNRWAPYSHREKFH